MHLIIQGAAPISALHIEKLTRLSRARKMEPLSPQAVRLTGAQPFDDLARLCQEAELDYAFMPEGLKLTDMKVFITDMDSTLIDIECIDEIADMNGFKAEVATITEAAMRGELDFAESLRARVKLLEGLEESALSRVYEERLGLNPGAERLLAGLKAAGITTALVSGGFTFFTEKLKTRLGFDHAWANVLEIRDGKLTGQVLGEIVDARAKATRLAELCAARNAGRDQAIAIGDGANDIEMLMNARIGIAYRAKPIVREAAACALNHAGLDGILNLFES
ncbi:MAG: phosphoserine phosphatase SerB [Rhodocyclaceae bacterium]|nr:MAG: phosphoserine phosphatase SerB [Rhodocyclaceae bacterium]